jgi:hypothetical protein
LAWALLNQYNTACALSSLSDFLTGLRGFPG